MPKRDLSADREIIEAATPGPWSFGIYGRDKPRAGSLVAAVAPGHIVLAVTGGGTYPSSDGHFIACARSRWHLDLSVTEAAVAWVAAADKLLGLPSPDCDGHGGGYHDPMPPLRQDGDELRDREKDERAVREWEERKL
jgi:hypothetical protein